MTTLGMARLPYGSSVEPCLPMASAWLGGSRCDWPGASRLGRAPLDRTWLDETWPGVAELGLAWLPWVGHNAARHVITGLGADSPWLCSGTAGLDHASLGWARHHVGKAGLPNPRRGWMGLGWAQPASPWPGLARQDGARHGEAWHSETERGTARLDEAPHD
jgi:hypothetical protein